MLVIKQPTEAILFDNCSTGNIQVEKVSTSSSTSVVAVLDPSTEEFACPSFEFTIYGTWIIATHQFLARKSLRQCEFSRARTWPATTIHRYLRRWAFRIPITFSLDTAPLPVCLLVHEQSTLKNQKPEVHLTRHFLFGQLSPIRFP